MNSKERIEMALSHKEADRVPIYNWLCSAIREELKNAGYN